MQINSYLIRLACMIILAFGGTFTLSYFKTGDLLGDQMLAAVAGTILLISSIIWRIGKKITSKSV